MKTIFKLGAAAALALGCVSVAHAQDAGVGVNVGAGVDGTVAVDAKSAVDANSKDPMGRSNTFGSLISTLNNNASGGMTIDLSAYSDTTTVNCVTVSSLQGEAGADAKALDNAISKNGAKLTSLQASIEAEAGLINKLDASCGVAGLADFEVNDVVAVATSADGAWTFYVDDRAA